MKITPLEIRQKSFEKGFRGYDKDEVKAFLLSLSKEWERLIDEYKELKFKLDASTKEVARLREVEGSLFKTLKTAEDTGANMVEQANKAAELHLKEAQMKADAILHDASSKATSMLEDAELKSKKILDVMYIEVKGLEQQYRDMERMRENMALELKNMANDTLQRVEKFKSAPGIDEIVKKAKEVADDQNELSATKKMYEQVNKTIPLHVKKEDADQDEESEDSSFFDELG